MLTIAIEHGLTGINGAISVSAALVAAQPLDARPRRTARRDSRL